MTGLSIKGVESDHHITGAFERSRRHPHIHATAVHDHVGFELLFEACKSHVLVCAEESKKRRRCWENQRNDDEVDCEQSLLFLWIKSNTSRWLRSRKERVGWKIDRSPTSPLPSFSPLICIILLFRSPCVADERRASAGGLMMKETYVVLTCYKAQHPGPKAH